MRMIANSLLFLVLFTQTLNAQEKHLKNIRQLTFGGDNAEAYFSPDGKNLSFQSNNKNWALNVIRYLTSISKKQLKIPLIFLRVSATVLAELLVATICPMVKTYCLLLLLKAPMFALKQKSLKESIFGVFLVILIYISPIKRENKKQLTQVSGYDAEATVSPKGDKIVFTSTRSGDLELWTMNIDGTNQQQITNQLGYDGGAFFSPDGQK